jgi:hypothetical protein
MKTIFTEVVKHFESRLNRKLTDVEYHILYSKFISLHKAVINFDLQACSLH